MNVAPPRDPELEEKVLGSLLSAGEVAPVCIPKLSVSSFTGNNKKIFKAIRDDFDENGDVDAIRVESGLKQQSEEPRAVSEVFGRLLSAWIPPDKAEHYVGILNGLAVKRKALSGMQSEINAISSRTPQELLTNLEKIIHDNLDSIEIPGLTPSQIEQRDQNRPSGEQLLTGDEFMDHKFFADSGSRRGQIIVPFGDTGHGKTFWAIWLASRYLDQGYNGVFCTFESTDTKIKDRIKSNIKSPSNLDNIIIADISQGMMSLDDSVSLIKYHNAVSDIDFFVCDHMRIIPVSGLPDWKENEKVTVCVNRYMRLAQEVSAGGVCISQINRDANRNNKGWSRDPQLQHLYGSSAIEQAAEMAISLFRPKEVEELRDYYPDGRLRAVRGPTYNKDSKTYDPDSVFIRQKKVREGAPYIPFVRFLHTDDGLQRVTENTPY